MSWIIGIDEAGYGPNLGPLVMTAVACRVPEVLAGADLWSVLSPAVRRAAKPADGQLFVGDSKLVYSPTRGLHALETGVLSILAPDLAAGQTPLAAYLDRLCPNSHIDVRNEPWYTGTSRLPSAADGDQCRAAAELMRQTCEQRQVCWGLVRSVVVCPTQFNACLDRWGSKGAVLGQALAELVRCHSDLDGERRGVSPPCAGAPVHFFIDKHGGRNTYAAVLQHALPEGIVIAQEESHGRSTYQVHGLPRPVCLTFQPRADDEHFCVALASMVSKYVRELLMAEFNAFWRQHVPDLKPTAGHPGDAARFYAAIRPAAERLGIPEAVLWRRK